MLKDIYTHGEWLGLKNCPYARRWILKTPFGTLRIHQWFSSDDPRYLHDHPWWFVTIVLRGGYTDVSNDGKDHLGRFSIRFRKANHSHYVDPDENGAITFLITGRHKRKWGFWIRPDKWVKSSRYFWDYGHPPCDD